METTNLDLDLEFEPEIIPQDPTNFWSWCNTQELEAKKECKRVLGLRRDPKDTDWQRALFILPEGETKSFLRAWLFIETTKKPLCDYWTYIRYFIETGEKMNPDFFQGDLDYLEYSYAKITKELAKTNPNMFYYELGGWKKAVYYLRLKLDGQYRPEVHDAIFIPEKSNKKDTREYNPVILLPRLLRTELGQEVKQFDIKAAYPTFISLMLGQEPRPDIYEESQKIWGCSRAEAKLRINRQINWHEAVVPGHYQKLITQLKQLWPTIDQVFTEEVWATKGAMYELLSEKETEAVAKFIEQNGITNWCRLHDCVMVPNTQECKTKEIDGVRWSLYEPVVPKSKTCWHVINSKGQLELDPIKLGDWLEENDFRVFRGLGGSYTYARHIVGGICKECRINDIINVMEEKNKIPKLSYKTVYGEKESSEEWKQACFLIANWDKFIQPWVNRKAKDLKTPPKSLDAIYFPTDMGILKVTATTKEIVKGYDLIHENRLLKLDTSTSLETILQRSNFARFLWSIGLKRVVTPDEQISQRDITPGALEESQSLLEYLTLLGEMMYDPAYGVKKMIVLTDEIVEGSGDEGEEDRKDGQRGKSITIKMMEHLFWTGQLDFEEYGGGKNLGYLFQKFKPGMRILSTHEQTKKIIWREVFQTITEEMPYRVHYSNTDYIPHDIKPRLILATNWIQVQSGPSHGARFYEYQFPKVWSDKIKPSEVYDEYFFDSWDENKWADFLRIAIFIAQVRLVNGLVEQPKNKDKDRFTASISYSEEDYIVEFLEARLGWNDPIRKEEEPIWRFTLNMFWQWLKEADLRHEGTKEFTARKTGQKFRNFFRYYNLPYQEIKGEFRLMGSYDLWRTNKASRIKGLSPLDTL